MSKLIPNLDDLRAQLPADGSGSDAREFIEELGKAASRTDSESLVDALFDRWLGQLDDIEH